MSSIIERLEKQKAREALTRKEHQILPIQPAQDSVAKAATHPPSSKISPFSARGERRPKELQEPQPPAPDGRLDELNVRVEKTIMQTLSPQATADMPKATVSDEIATIIKSTARELKISLSDDELKGLHTYMLNGYLAREAERLTSETSDSTKKAHASEKVLLAKDKIYNQLMEQIDPSTAIDIPRAELAEQISDVVGDLLAREKISLNLKEQKELVLVLLNDMLGLGPLEPLLADENVTDIMVNTHKQVYVEQKGKLRLTDVTFRDERHLMNIATRIVTAIGRRVDESSPICDARLADGSRVNVIIPPLAIDGISISIRKFAKQKITLDKMIEQGNISKNMGTVLKIAGASRLNILISGGTGSGKTTLLNAISKMIDQGERIVTIEDAAELQMQQPHVIRLETRPPNLEGSGEVTMRDLVKNALRMRPDRIILGEIRGAEAVDMLQAMNTGHDGSLGTIHANSPREALTRLENMIGMAGINLAPKAVRTQIADALDMIVQISRMRDGKRRIISITEVVGMEGDVITMQELFKYEATGEDEGGMLKGDFLSSSQRPHFLKKAEYFGLGRPLMAAMG